MSRIVVSGCSCAGKSTLAGKLSTALGIHHIQLDALSWKKNWVERENEDFLHLLQQEVTKHDAWVIDGNYSRSHPISWPLADAFIWLNYPFRIVMGRALKRTTRRVFTQEELFSGNKEGFRRAFLSTDSILLWVLKTHYSHRLRYGALMDGQRALGKVVVELNHPDETTTLLDRLSRAGVTSLNQQVRW